MNPFITPQNIFSQWQKSKTYTDQITKPFPEFQRIARNEPYTTSDPAYPNVTDGTTASIVQKTPKRVVQQLPSGRVVTDDEGWLGIVADFIYTHKIIPYANEDYGVLEKSHLVIENGLTYGSCVTYAPFLNHEGYFCPDMTLPYWGDVYLQKGKKSGRSCKYVFIRSWWQKEDIDALIKSEKQLAAQAGKRKEKYEATWDTEALSKVMESAKDSQAQTPVEKERGVDNNAVELVTAFQIGVKAKFYTMNPATSTIVRTKVNKDPRGKMPLDWFYGDIDGTNPLGRGIVELIGGLQNLIDSDMQAYQYNRALALQPPVVKYGNVGNFSFAPNAVLDASSDPTAKIVPLTVDTSALINYPALYGLQKSQLLNLVNSPDTSISSQVGNPSFSKTSQGVQAQQAVISVDDNAVEKSFERWFEDWSETAINLYFAERTGVEELQLDKETAARLRELPTFDQTLLNDKNQILVDYDTDTPILKFKVDPSTTSIKDSVAQVADATNLLDMVMKYPMLNSSFGGPIDIDVLARRIVVNSGIDDPEQVAPEPTAAQKQAKQEAKDHPNAFSPMFDKPSIRMNYPDLPPAAQVQLLANAGIQVTEEDVLQGPVADPNVRGIFNPFADPNTLLPGMAQSTQGPNGQPIVQPTQPATQSSAQVPTAIPPPNPLQPAPQPQLPPEDLQLIAQLRQRGTPDNVISQVISSLNQGVPVQEVIKQLGGGNG